MPERSVPVFDRLDTVVLRVADCQVAVAWYREALGLSPVFVDAAEGLAVLGLQGCALTLWQRKPGEAAPAEGCGAFPIFAIDDAAAAHAILQARGVRVDALADGDGVRFFAFFDADGNRLEACQVLQY